MDEQINSTKWRIKLAEKVAKQGDVEAQINMGVSCLTGNVVPQDQGKPLLGLKRQQNREM